MRRAPFVTVIGLFVLFIVSAGTPAARAGTILGVTRLDDPPPNGCAEDDCSLREAVIAANANPDASVITLPLGTVNLTIAGSGSDPAVGDLELTEDVEISGPGPDQTTVDANGIAGVFEVPNFNFLGDPTTDVLLQGMTITGSSHSPGVYSASNLTVDNVVITGNHNDDDDGGGIEAFGGLTTVRNSTISNNTAGFTGGGTDVSSLVIENSTVIGNTSGIGGGGVAAEGLTMVNTTVVGNDGGPEYGGGGVVINGNLTLIEHSTITNSTIAGNEQGGDGGGGLFVRDNVSPTLTNTVLWNNTASSGPQCKGTITGVANIVESVSGCTLSGTVLHDDPLLFPLGDYGGPTQTMGIPENSPARDGGDAGACPDTDQREIPRPQHNPDSGYDIGAFEFMYLGDVDCSGTVDTPDIIAEFTAIAGVAKADCYYRGDLDCNLAKNGIDGLFIVRHLGQIEEQLRPMYCPAVGPDAPAP